MDSIMKNLKYTTNYTTIFEKSMVNLFIKVFECVSFFFILLLIFVGLSTVCMYYIQVLLINGVSYLFD